MVLKSKRGFADLGRGRWRSGRRHCASGSAPGTPTLTVQQELRRRIEKVGRFPNEDSPARLTSAMLVEIADKMSRRNQSLHQMGMPACTITPAPNFQTTGCSIGLLSGVDTEKQWGKGQSALTS
ncbi:hypothetical protein [Primorskyibacter flagellatus]|uniref:hypothetical protein n=1 Tax=Primorskyibacter flagellatus TaxID=1387277 RepID=UPI003A8CDB96